MDLISAMLKRCAEQHAGIVAADATRSLSWSDLAESAGRLAGGLKRMGMAMSEPVGVLALNSTYIFECFFGIAWAGGMVCPLNFRLSANEMDAIAADAGLRILIADSAFAAAAIALRARLPQIEQLILIEPETVGGLDYATLLDGASLEISDRRESDPACLYYTGGTTGVSKGVVLTHGAVFANMLNFQITTGASELDHLLHSGPHFHVAAGSRVFNSVLTGARSHIIPRFQARQVLEAIERQRITMISVVPTMLHDILALEDLGRYDLSTLRLIQYGAAPISPTLLDQAMARLPHVGLNHSYGQTECAPLATSLPHCYHVRESGLAGKLRSAGRAAPSVEVAIVAPDDHPLPSGQVGEIVIRGPNVMSGYFNRPEETAWALRGGWLHSGDLGYLDEDGFLFVVDRLKDMIISGGENVYCSEVEDAITSHPAVDECAVIGVPHERWGEAVHAVVVHRPGAALSEADIIAHCRTRIGGFKLPSSIELRDTPLPRSNADKILKRALRNALDGAGLP